MTKDIKFRIKPELWARVQQCIGVKGWTFAEFVRRTFNEFLSKEGF